MSSRKIEIQVGITVILSILILVGGILWGKGVSSGLRRYKIHVEFSNIGGMEIGSNVLANGVVKGRVTDIRLADGKVFVEAKVDNDVVLFSDYIIGVESPTLMAGKALAIYPGGKPPLINASLTLVGTDPIGANEAISMFTSVASDAEITLKNLNDLIVNLNYVASDSANRSHIKGMLASAHSTAEQTSNLIHQHSAQISSTIDKLDSSLSSFQRIAATAENRIGPTMTAVDTAASAVAKLAESLRSVSEKLERDDNTFGRLLSDDTLYVKLNRTLAEVESLAVSIRTKGMKQRIVLF